MATIRLIEVSKSSNVIKNSAYTLREVYINPEHVVCVRENDSLKMRLSDTELGKDIHPAESYTKIYINRGQSGLDLDVVGDLAAIKNKLQGRK